LLLSKNIESLQIFGDKELGGSIRERALCQGRKKTFARGRARQAEQLFQREDTIAARNVDDRRSGAKVPLSETTQASNG